ncbi:MAP10 protein, partial [Bucorvus abyssinicus]|nr:MAP10 protein [Bucorvus abyssinicus]
AEGLFSLELLVEAVRVAAPAPALRPAVALRFLDFPTLLLRPAAVAPPLRPGWTFPFGRGKRCLFRWRRDSLCAALRSRPLRAMLLVLPAELTPGPPSLLGSCGVSLASAAENLLQRPGTPASYGRRGSFPLRDAAGRPVGELILGYRLTSLEVGEESPPPNPASPRAATLPATSPEPVGEEEEEGEELEGNIFCPPMLYYSHEAAEPHLPPAAAGTAQWEHVKTWGRQENNKGQSPPHPSAGPSLLHPASSQQLHNTLSQLPLLSALLAELSVLAHSTTPASVHPHLAWPHQAPGSSGMASQPLSPSRSCALKHAEAPVGPSGNNGAASPRFKQGQQEATSPGSSWSARGPKKTVSLGETGSERNCKTKENRPPRKKLLYGLTNTLRLRLKQTNPDKLIIHERREQYRKKQMEKLKEKSPLSKRKLLRCAGEHVASHRHCSKGDTSKQNNQFDKTVETSLQNSGALEYIGVTGDVSPDLRKRAITSLLKNDEIASKEHPCKVTTATLPEETVLKSAQKEKYAKTQLPASFPSDANAKGSNEEAIHFIHPKTSDHLHDDHCIMHSDASFVSDHKPRPSRSVENNSEFIYSDDFIASPENTLYSEDFTSAEWMDRVSEALDNTPEPLWLESSKQGWSDTESESSRSRISKTSQRDESTSDLLPVPSASSPVQSLKRNRDLKTSKRTSGEAVDSLILVGMEASLLDEEREAQHTNKEENRGDQDIKQVATLRSKQVSSDTDLNIGKGQNSAGKSQSETQVSSYLPSNMSDLELGVLENSMSDKADYFLEKLRVPNQCKDISELVINKLPGYTM